MIIDFKDKKGDVRMKLTSGDDLEPKFWKPPEQESTLIELPRKNMSKEFDDLLGRMEKESFKSNKFYGDNFLNFILDGNVISDEDIQKAFDLEDEEIDEITNLS